MNRSAACLLLAALLLAACSPEAPLSATAVPAPATAPVATSTPAQEPTATAPAELVLSPEPPESLTVAELHARLDPFAVAVEGCTLPCYVGLQPGAAALSDVLAFYARLGIGTADLIPGDWDAVQDGTGRVGAWLTKTVDADQAEAQGLPAPLVDIYVEDDALQYAYIGWQYLPPYLTAARVVGALGPPDEVKLGLVLDEELPVYTLHLVYTGKRAAFAYYGRPQGDAVQRSVCLTPGEIDRTFFGLFAPEAPLMGGLAYQQYLLPAGEALGLPAEQVVAQLGAGGCLTVSAEQAAQWAALGGE